MMVPKIITHAAAVVSQNKKDGVLVLGRETLSKSKRHSPPTSFLGSSTNVPATRLERRSRTAQSNRTQGYVAHFRKNHHRLLHSCSYQKIFAFTSSYIIYQCENFIAYQICLHVSNKKIFKNAVHQN